MKNLRCPKCNKLIFKYRLNGELEVEFKCSRCNEMTVTKLITKE